MTKVNLMDGLFVLSLVQLTPAQAQDLLLYGGVYHKEFLGCLNCSAYQYDSVCNTMGAYGNNISSTSIFNEYSNYGSAYSNAGVWNKYSTSKEVPVLVDRAGNFYGYFSINSYRDDVFKESSALRQLYDLANGDLSKVQKILCSD